MEGVVKVFRSGDHSATFGLLAIPDGACGVSVELKISYLDPVCVFAPPGQVTKVCLIGRDALFFSSTCR